MSVVTLVGCGALGSLLAARMIEGGLRVQLLQRSGAQHDALRESGIRVHGDRGKHDRSFMPDAVSSDAAELPAADLAIVLVKSYDTSRIVDMPPRLTDNGIALTLQNGMGNAEKLSALFEERRVAAGIATYGAYQIAPGEIGWGGEGHITIGPWQVGNDMAWVVDMLTQAGLSAEYIDDPRPAMWQKLAINAMVNTVTALTGVRNGQTLESTWSTALMEHLGREAVLAASRAGVPLEFDGVWKVLEDNLRRTSVNRTSMLQDVQAGRKTEVDAILGPVLNHAKHEQEMPTTRTILGLIKTIEVFRG